MSSYFLAWPNVKDQRCKKYIVSFVYVSVCVCISECVCVFVCGRVRLCFSVCVDKKGWKVEIFTAHSRPSHAS